MSLRTKLLGLFGVLAIAPLLAISVFDYWRSDIAIRHLLETQTTAVADRVAKQGAQRLAVIEGQLALLAFNEETRHFLRTGEGRDAAMRFIQQAVPVVGASIESIALRDASGRELFSLLPQDSLSGGLATPERLVSLRSAPPPSWPIALAITDDAGRRMGTLTITTKLDTIVPRVLLNDRVGISGSTTLVLERSPETKSYSASDTTWIASIAPIGESGLAVSSVASVDEFAAPLGQIWVTNLLLALCVTAAMAVAFLIVAGRLSRPLEALTAAADEVGRGNFAPALPPAGTDEVGRLAANFARMSAQIAGMMRQVESSRQMAAVGAFSAQIAHEIRNPLTSIKLNLQSLERDLRDGAISPSARRPLEICMEEIHRLDKVVRGVLQLGSASLHGAERISLHEALRAAANLTQPQLAAHRVTLELDCAATEDGVIGDRDRLRGVLLNLLLNAVDALPDGGQIRVSTAIAESAGTRSLQVRIADNGPGVAPKDRDNVFEPFYSTKRHGSGLGLALATRDVERHRGRLSLLDSPGELGGATFVVELPLATNGAS